MGVNSWVPMRNTDALSSSKLFFSTRCKHIPTTKPTMTRSRRRLNTATRHARLCKEEATFNLKLSFFGNDVLANIPPNPNDGNFKDAFPACLHRSS